MHHRRRALCEAAAYGRLVAQSLLQRKVNRAVVFESLLRCHTTAPSKSTTHPPTSETTSESEGSEPSVGLVRVLVRWLLLIELFGLCWVVLVVDLRVLRVVSCCNFLLHVIMCTHDSFLWRP